MIMVITSRILSMTHIDFIIGSFLGFLTYHISFTLLGHNLIDKTFLALEVIAHFLRLIRSITILEDRQARFHSRTVYHTTGIDRAAIHVHGNHLGSQLNLFVIHLTLTIQISKASFRKHDGVICFVYHRCIQWFFFLSTNRIKRNGISTQGIHSDAIIYTLTTVACPLGS